MAAREFGIDPAEEIQDPWLAWQLRIGLLARLRKQESDASKTDTKAAKLQEHKNRMDAARQKLMAYA